MLINANAYYIPFRDGVFQCAVTSPPYWGLRDYGLPQLVWGGSLGCVHRWGDIEHYAGGGQPGDKVRWQHTGSGPSGHPKAKSQFCQLCNAWRGSLGLEPTPELYVEHMVAVFREVKRVLRDDGVCWLNLGDSYAANRGYQVPDSKHRDVGNSQGMKASSFGLKPKDLVGIPWRVAFALQADGWWLRSDVIWHKCLSGGTRLYARTQKGDGVAMLKDLARLAPETVKLWNGDKWTQVTGWTKTARPDNPVEIVLRSGERIGCTPDHRWPTQRGNVRADALEVGDTIETTHLPEPQESKRPVMLPDDLGWFVGMYLAEGSRDTASRIQISSHIKEQSIFERLRKIAAMYGGTCNQYQESKNGMMITMSGRILNAIVDTYIKGNTAKYKHLSSECWKRNNEFLHSVLLGYLEGDGHYDAPNDRWRIGFTRNYALESDLRTICARLGYHLRVKPSVSKSQNGEHPSFRGEIRFRKSNHHNTKSDSEIVEIRRSRARQFWDVSVKDAPHLFALASGVLTHNSNCMPESVTDRPTKSHEYVFLLTKSARYFYDADAIKQPAKSSTIKRASSGTWRNMEERPDIGYPGANSRNKAAINRDIRDKVLSGEHPTVNRRSVWTIPTQSYAGAHFATFPEKLVEPCILAGTSARGECPVCGLAWKRIVESTRYEPPVVPVGERNVDVSRRDKTRKINGKSAEWRNAQASRQTTGWAPQCTHDAEPVPQTILDPFAGTATAGRVSIKHGRQFVGLELNPDYIGLAQERTSRIQVAMQL